MIKDRYSDKWEIFEDRVPAREVNDFDREQVHACLIFLQEPRYWIDGETDEVADVAFKVCFGFTAKDMLLEETPKSRR